MDRNAHLSPDTILIDVDAHDKWALIEVMVDALMESEPLKRQPEITREIVRNSIVSRERNHPTGLGSGFAYPHGRIEGFSGAALCVAMPKRPLDFSAPDGKPAEIVTLMAAPQDDPQLALQIMSQFVRLLAVPEEREFILRLRDAKALSAFLRKRVLRTDIAITAHDIMRPSYAEITPDMPLSEVTRIMSRHNADTVAVVESDGTLLGQVTCDSLFKFGMPAFFSQLKSIAFISEFDPFEKYFEDEGKTVARDVMSLDYAAMPEEATLLEVVFALAVERHPKVFVVRDGKRVGVIDRSRVLDWVINI